MGFAAEDLDLYRYVNNDPYNGADPLGLLAPPRPSPQDPLQELRAIEQRLRENRAKLQKAEDRLRQYGWHDPELKGEPPELGEKPIMGGLPRLAGKGEFCATLLDEDYWRALRDRHIFEEAIYRDSIRWREMMLWIIEDLARPSTQPPLFPQLGPLPSYP